MVRFFSKPPFSRFYLYAQQETALALLSSKWKKRVVVFRFKTDSGPPILEVSKDEKKSSQREILDLSVTTSIEVGGERDAHDTFAEPTTPPSFTRSPHLTSLPRPVPKIDEEHENTVCINLEHEAFLFQCESEGTCQSFIRVMLEKVRTC